ncbi:S8 family serine peptidase [Wenzhouxiangella sediminis]|uniref:S8 family serine peptidase n=1 Tax=Wenzhouxiangella sediminis TaxID=1792836 RepID=UPI0015F2965D|nr:S8 family serine peptidase [Wenzhouxiangella sediminis]
MKHRSSRLAALAGAAGLLLSATAMAADGRYIIQFAPGAAGQGKAAVKAMGGDIKVDLSNRSINAVAVSIPEQALNGLRNNPNVISVEEDARVYPMAETVPYGITMVQADQLSDSNAGGINVCIIDSGYHAGHFDLQANPVNGLNLSGSGDPFIDSCGHGTHVAGTIAAVNNGDGVIGVMPGANVNLTIAKIFGDDDWTSGSCGYSYTSSTIQAAYDCADAGADVINMSLGGSQASSTAEQGFQDLLDNYNVLSIAAAGNDGTTGYSYPASYPSVVSVAAIDDTKTVADFSQKNDQVELSGPGVAVLSTVPTISATAEVAGTSYVVSVLDGAASATASGTLVDGGLCDSAGNWSGDIVLCQRGSIAFGDKVANVEAGGGSGAIIYNNESGGFLGVIECNGPSWRACSAIPAVSTSDTAGADMLTQLGASATVSTQATAPADGYDSYNGTSMATPHVAGVAALVWSQVPTATAADIRAALVATAEDLGSSGRDNSYGYGLVQAADAVAYLGGDGGGGGDTNVAPSAAFTYSCAELACDFDGTGSIDSDGTIASYSWSFGDGNSASGSSASHTYGGDGSYTVTLTVTDDAGATDSTSQVVTVEASTGGGGDISLSANGYKNKGRWTTDLSWSGATSSDVDIYRDGSLLTTVSNSGSYTDATSFKGGGSLTYQVCEAGSTTCSDSVTVVF